jgi:hypothetical protein
MWSVALPRMRRSGLSAMVVAALAGCGDPPAQVRLTPLGGCARPVGGNLVKVTAYATTGERSETVALDETVAIASFPADTEQIGVEVLVSGGATGAAGKSPPLDFAALADGAIVPVFMAPPDGFCEVGQMTEERLQPLVARAGDGAFVVGGVGAAGPLATAEYYNAATAAFSPVEVPPAIVDRVQGLAGAALATLPDGRVALIGGAGNGFAVFDPATRELTGAQALPESRAFHAAIAVADDVLVAGGCSAVEVSQCGGVSRRQILRYRLDQIGDPDRALPTTGDMRIGSRLFDLGVQLGGRHEYLLLGGSGRPELAERFALDDAAATTLTGGQAQPVALDGGAVLAAFAPDGAVASGAAAVYAPGAAAPRPIAPAPDLTSVRLIALEDGRIAGFGGDPMGRVLLYDPTRDAWEAAVPASGDRPGAMTAPSLVRLGDGSVLVLGGTRSSQAWLYRPSLVGPASGSITAVPAEDTGVLTAPDPGTVMRVANPPEWRLVAPGDALTARALVGGPRTATGSVRAIVRVRAGGVALIAQQTAPGQAIVAELVPEQAPRLTRLDGGVARVLCSRPPALPAFDPAVAVALRLAISDRDARLSIDGVEVLVCELEATDRGSWGVAALGTAAQITVDSVTVAR